MLEGTFPRALLAQPRLSSEEKASAELAEPGAMGTLIVGYHEPAAGKEKRSFMAAAADFFHDESGMPKVPKDESPEAATRRWRLANLFKALVIVTFFGFTRLMGWV